MDGIRSREDQQEIYIYLNKEVRRKGECFVASYSKQMARDTVKQ
jgi:hypothetical protein